MPTIPAGIGQVHLFTTYENSAVQYRNILYYAPESPLTGAENCSVIANDFLGELAPTLSSVVADTCQITGVYFRYKAVGIDIEGFSTDVATSGDGGDDAMSPEVCMCIRRLTGKPGRNKRGRIFLTGIAEDHYSDGKLVPASYVEGQAVAAKFADVLSAGGLDWAPRHWDRKTNTMEPISGCKVVIRAVSRRDRTKRYPYQAI